MSRSIRFGHCIAAALLSLVALGLGPSLHVVGRFLVTEAWARTARLLTAPEELRPVRWRESLRFAPGQTWFDDVDGGVQSGNLAQPYGLPIWNGVQRLESRPAQDPGGGFVSCGAGFIRFEAAGGVMECTLAFDSELQVIGAQGRAVFAAGTRVSFGYDAGVSRGTLAREAAFPRSSGDSEVFPAGTGLSFDTAGHVANAVVSPKPELGPFDAPYGGALTLTIGGRGLGYATPTIAVPFAVTVAGGVLSGGADAAGPPGGYNLRWSGNVGPDGTIANGRVTGFVHRLDDGQWLRWTVSGPLDGRFVPGGGSGTLSLTTSDGLAMISGQWQVGPVPPVPAIAATGPGAAGAASISRWTSRAPSSPRLPLQTVDDIGFAPGSYVIFVADTDATGRGITSYVSFGPHELRAGETWHAAIGRGLVFEREMTPSAAGTQRATIQAENRDIQRWKAICVLPAGSPVSLCLGGSQNVVGAPGTTAAPATGPGGASPAGARPELPGNLVGEWDWFVNGTVVFHADGTGQQGRLTVRWTLIDPSARTYRLVWSHGYTDTVTLSPDGSSLEGRNTAGSRITARRRGATSNAAGPPSAGAGTR